MNYDVDTHAYDEVRYEEHRARVRDDECSQDPGAPSFPETSEPTAGLDAPPAPQVISQERE